MTERFRVSWTDSEGKLHLEGYKTREDAEWRSRQLREQGFNAVIVVLRS